MRWLPGAVFLLAISAISYAATFNVVVAPNRVQMGVVIAPDPYGFARGVDGTGNAILHGSIPVNIIWYNSISHPWVSTGQQPATRAFFNNLATSAWWSMWAPQYPNASGLTATGMFVNGECDDPEAQGTTIGIPDVNFAVNDAITNCGWVDSPTIMYVLLPSWTDVSLMGGAGGLNEYTGTRHLVVAKRGAGFRLISTNPDPSGDVTYDSLMHLVSGELVGSVTGSPNGWSATIGPAYAPYEVCQITDGSHFFTAPNGQLANWNTGSNYFVLNDVWNLGPLFACDGQPSPTKALTARCMHSNTPGDCLGNCLGGVCQTQSCTDGIKDWDEPDVDCGSVCANTLDLLGALCVNGSHCFSWEDCQSSLGGSGTGACPAGTCL